MQMATRTMSRSRRMAIKRLRVAFLDAVQSQLRSVPLYTELRRMNRPKIVETREVSVL